MLKFYMNSIVVYFYVVLFMGIYLTRSIKARPVLILSVAEHFCGKGSKTSDR